MQISKSLVVCGAVLLCLVSIPARGEDTPEEARLREALRQKMAETAPVEPVAPAPAKPAKPARAPKRASTVVVAPAPAITVVEPAPVVSKPVAVPVVSEPAPIVAPIVTTTVPDASVTMAPVGEDDPQAARLRQALRERMGQSTAAPVVTAGEPAALSNTAILNSSTTVVAAPTALDPAPALPISGSKSERLATLLQQYKADQITPQQYHEQRARILAE